MDIASMVLGIISAILAFVPVCNYAALLPAGIGLILGIVDLAIKSKREQSVGMAVAGVVLNVVAIVIIVLWTFVLVAASTE